MRTTSIVVAGCLVAGLVATTGAAPSRASAAAPLPSVVSLSSDTGLDAGGATVDIEGTGLSEPTAVDFGDTPAASFTPGTYGISAVAPAGTGTVDVTVTTAGGTSAASTADQYTYLASAVAPDAPTGLIGNPDDGQVGLSWEAPEDAGGDPITGWVVTPSIGSTALAPIDVTGSSQQTTVASLANGTAYTFTVAAVTAAGTGAPSASAGPFTPAPAPGTGTVVIGGGQVTATVATAGQLALFDFDATAGERVTGDFSGSTFSSSSDTLYLRNLEGAALGVPAPLDTASGYLPTVTIPASGSYQLVVDPSTTGDTGQVDVTLTSVTDEAGDLTIGGPGVPVDVTTQGQRAVLDFSGTAAERVSLSYSSNTFVAGGAELSVQGPGGATIGAVTPVSTSSGIIPAVTLPSNGDYEVLVDPTATGATGSISVAATSITDVVAPITTGGPAVTATVNVTGQRALLPFTATAGERVSVSVSGSTFPDGDGTTVTVDGPSGSPVEPALAIHGGGAYLPPVTLAAAGSYQVVVDPTASGDTGSATVSLFSVTDQTGTITAGGTPVTATITTPGQRALLTFTGTAGEQITVHPSADSFPNDASTTLSVDGPSGRQIGAAESLSGTAAEDLLPVTLPSNGTYTVMVDPSAQGDTGSVTLELDTVESASLNGASVTATIPTGGDQAVVAFTGSAGESVSVQTQTDDFPTDFGTVMYIANDHGVDIGPSQALGSTGPVYLAPVTLPSDGTYQLIVSGTIADDLGAVTLDLLGSDTETGALTVNGPAVAADLTVAGQPAEYSFTADKGERIAGLVTGATVATYGATVSIAEGSPTTVIASRPLDGYATDVVGPLTIPATGTYYVTVSTFIQGQTGTLDLAVVNFHDQTADIKADGAAVTAKITVPGQRAIYRFTGTAGQVVSVVWSASTFAQQPDTIALEDGSGNVLMSKTLGTSGYLAAVTLSSDGAYQIVVDPSFDGDTGQVKVKLDDVINQTGPIAIGGAAVKADITVPGQDADFSFTTTQPDQLVTIHVTGSSFGIFDGLGIADSSGSLVGGYNAGDGWEGPYTLAQAGTYTVELQPSDNVGKATLELVGFANVTGELRIGGPAVTAHIRVPGQQAVYAFSTTKADQEFSVYTSKSSFGPYDSLAIEDSAGNVIDGATPSNGVQGPFTIASPGTYQLVLSPDDRTGAATFSLHAVTNIEKQITLNGPSVTAKFTVGGQKATFTFKSPDADQAIAVSISNSSFGPYDSMYILDASGNQVAGGTPGNGVQGQYTLPAAGTYRLVVAPDNSTGSITVNLLAFDNVTGPISLDGAPVTADITVPAQRALFSFTTTVADQQLSVDVSNSSFGPYDSMYIQDVSGNQYGGATPSNGMAGPFTLGPAATYQLVLAPNNETGSATFALTDLEPPYGDSATRALALDVSAPRAHGEAGTGRSEPSAHPTPTAAPAQAGTTPTLGDLQAAMAHLRDRRHLDTIIGRRAPVAHDASTAVAGGSGYTLTATQVVTSTSTLAVNPDWAYFGSQGSRDTSTSTATWTEDSAGNGNLKGTYNDNNASWLFSDACIAYQGGTGSTTAQGKDPADIQLYQALQSDGTINYQLLLPEGSVPGTAESSSQSIGCGSESQSSSSEPTAASFGPLTLTGSYQEGQQSVTGTSDCGSGTSVSTTELFNIVGVDTVSCKINWTLTFDYGDLILKQTDKTPFWDLNLVATPPQGMACPVAVNVESAGIFAGGNSTAPGSNCQSILVRMPVFRGTAQMTPGAGNVFHVTFVPESGGATSLLRKTLQLPPAPVWVATGDSTSSGWNQQLNGFEYKQNDALQSWPYFAYQDLNYLDKVPAPWQMAFAAYAVGGTTSGQIRASGEAVDVELHLHGNSWNVVSFTGGANDLNLAGALQGFYGSGQFLGNDPPWSEFPKGCPSSLQAGLTKMLNALKSNGTMILDNLYDLTASATGADPTVRFLEQGYEYVTTATSTCAPTATEIIDGLNSILHMVGSATGNAAVISPVGLWQHNVSNLQEVFFYGYPHVRLSVQQSVMAPEAAWQVEDTWGGP